MPQRPAENEYAPYYANYIALVPEDDILRPLAEQMSALQPLANLPEDKQMHRYAEDKWSVREVVGHLGDVERVFGYRAFCISRGGQARLPGFDENAFVATANFDHRNLVALVDEFALLREANLVVLRSLDEIAWQRTGIANDNLVSVRALAYIMVGHARHHLAILRERYGVGR